ncbi:hypothetical protein, partial [Acidocella sp.]|uniref:hypothetical protein n=1 Tax=Acidocella sp. TaxID=50710 RepID=UPI00262D4554
MAAIREAANHPPQTLTHMQVHALAGVYYKARLAVEEATPGDRVYWEVARDDLLSDYLCEDETGEWFDYEPTARAITEAEEFLAERRLCADAPSIHAMAQALWLAKVQLAETMMRRAAGDYGPDEYAGRFPEASVMPAQAPPEKAPSGPVLTFEELVRGWAR